MIDSTPQASMDSLGSQSQRQRREYTDLQACRRGWSCAVPSWFHRRCHVCQVLYHFLRVLSFTCARFSTTRINRQPRIVCRLMDLYTYTVISSLNIWLPPAKQLPAYLQLPTYTHQHTATYYSVSCNRHQTWKRIVTQLCCRNSISTSGLARELLYGL